MNNLEAVMTEQTLVHGIDKLIFEESGKLATHIFEKSSRLTENYDVDSFVSQLYNQRRSAIMDLVGPTGRKEFAPKSMYNAIEDSEKQYSEALEDIRKAYNLTPLNSDEAADLKTRYEVLKHLRSRLDNMDYLANKVPKHVMDDTSRWGVNGKPYMSSPKLSRWLSKLAGESSSLLAWYTNRCPKGEAVLGEREEYRIILSVLPHDIAGMSYYAPYNWDGERWLDGYAGTSCMDTICNGGGDAMHQLPANLSDPTLMVAMIVKSNGDKPHHFHALEEVMMARMLVRVVEIDGKTLMIGQRIYAFDRDTQKLITEGMATEFGKDYIHCETLENKFYGDSRTLKFSFRGPSDSTSECPRCDGDGYDEDGDECDRCDGSGQVGSIENPYNDNPSTFSFGPGYVKFHIPKRFIAQWN